MNINWNDVKNKWPKSYEKFKLFKADKEFGTKLSPSYLNEWFNKNIKSICYCDIEKFFDDNGLIIIINAYTINHVIFWDYTILDNRYKNLAYNDGYNSRPQAQETAIQKAFEIMEGRLNEKE